MACLSGLDLQLSQLESLVKHVTNSLDRVTGVRNELIVIGQELDRALTATLQLTMELSRERARVLRQDSMPSPSPCGASKLASEKPAAPSID